MKRFSRNTLIALFCLIGVSQSLKAQWATFDVSNLTQAVLSFIQDGDSISENTLQFLENIGVAKEQLQFIKELRNNFREVRKGVYQMQEVARIANNYEHLSHLYSTYIDRIKGLNGTTLSYDQISDIVRQGSLYLVLGSREVKRARMYLSKDSRISEEERIKGLINCDKNMSRVNAAMYRQMKNTYAEIDRAQRSAQAIKGVQNAFKITYK